MSKYSKWVAYPKEDVTVRLEMGGMIPDVFDVVRPTRRRVQGWLLGFSVGLLIASLLAWLL